MKRITKKLLTSLMALAVCASAIRVLPVDAAIREEKEWNNNRKHAETVESEEIIIGQIDSMDDLDVYKFVPEESGDAVISLYDVEDINMRWFLWLMDENWEPLASSTDKTQSTQNLEYSVKAGEVYYVVVGPWDKLENNFSDKVFYTLKVSSDDVPLTAEIDVDGKKLIVSDVDRLVYAYSNPAMQSVLTSDSELISEFFEMLSNAKFTVSDEFGVGSPTLIFYSTDDAIATMSRRGDNINLTLGDAVYSLKAVSGFWSPDEWDGFIGKFADNSDSWKLSLPLTNGQSGYTYIQLKNIDKIRFSTDTPNALNPETDDPKLISELLDMLNGLELGEPIYVGEATGGTSLLLYSGNRILSILCSDTVLYYDNYQYPIISGGWDNETWLNFVKRCDGRFDVKEYSKLYK